MKYHQKLCWTPKQIEAFIARLKASLRVYAELREFDAANANTLSRPQPLSQE